MADYAAERAEVLEAVRRIVALGLVAGASGNVSRRIAAASGRAESPPPGDDPARGRAEGPSREGDYRELFAITASRVPYHRFGIDDVLVVDGDVEPLVGDGIPSSESLAHLAVYAARPDVGAVIHTHSPYASAFAVAGQPIPCILDEQVVTLGGEVAVAEYAASASQELADNAVRALGDRAAVLLRHHGVLGVGRDLEEAVAVVELVERVAQVRLLSLRLGGGELADEIVQTERAMYRMMKGMRG
jgi:L-fuculose-phosphate aldolase